MRLTTRPLRLDLHEFPQLALPCILHWNLNHFVVLVDVRKNWQGKTILTVQDPAVGERRLTLEEASDCFTGIALEIAPAPDFKQSNESRNISVKDLTGHIIGLRRAVFQILMLAVALELLTIIGPLFNQFVIDEVIVSGDVDLLEVLTIGFGLLMIVQTLIGLARSWFLMRWSMDVGYQWSGRVFSHLIRLPISFFEKRHLGDVVSRFQSTNSIQSTLTNLFVESFLDGLMALFAVGMMLMYSPSLTSLVIAAAAIYGLVRWAFHEPFREASRERLILSARENSHFLETVRAITPLRLFGREEERTSRWLNLKMDVQNRDVRTQKLSIIFKMSNTAIFGLQNLLLFYFGAKLVMSNILTVGMLTAFASYAGTFSGRIANLIDVFSNLKMLRMHTERLGDIVLEKREEANPYHTDLSGTDGRITLKDVKFRYGEGEPWVLNGINLDVEAGSSIALVGLSGSGKTTLCKLMLGLLQPSEGEILIDGIPVSQIGIDQYRRLIGTVMQDDVLLAGSILENICFFDSQPNLQLVEQCAEHAAIHEDIKAMPMAYQTLVGDMGSSLSGGQKQRILLARALYKNPKILALDEATSHLDISNEHKVNLKLSQMKLTRIIVAHRPETIRSAHDIYMLSNGRLEALPPLSISPPQAG